MDHSTISKAAFLIILGVLLFLGFKIIQPYISYLIMGVILSTLFMPLYDTLSKRIRNKSLCSLTSVLAVLFIIIIPTMTILAGLVMQASTAYRSIHGIELFDSANSFATKIAGTEINISYYVQESLLHIKNYIINTVPNFIGSIADILLGLFIMCFVMFYLFKQGKELYTKIKERFPLKKEYKEALFSQFSRKMHAVLYGNIVSAIVQGAVAGLGFFIFDIPNPIFWGFIMIIFAFLPVVGTPIIWIPASIIEILEGHVFSGIGMFAFGLIIVSNIDPILKPKLISNKTKMHPVVALLGVLGGLNFFGFIGMFIGPLIIEMLIILVKLYLVELESETDDRDIAGLKKPGRKAYNRARKKDK